jgi:energy-converting hydrogenase Eha subunit E
MLLCISIIVVASSAAYHDSQNCHGSDSDPCKRNKFAISLGSVGTVIGLVISFMANAGKLHVYMETATAFLVFALYTAGVALITFDTGSGITIGNLYFSTWAGFIVSVFLLVECYHGVKEEREGGTSINTATDDPVVKIQDNKATGADIKVEDLPDAEQPF